MKLIELESANEDGSDGLAVLVNPDQVVFIRQDKRSGRRCTSYIQFKTHYHYVYGSVKMLKDIFERVE